MDEQYEVLATRAISRYHLLQNASSSSTISRRLLIAVAGSPGSGKTTSTTTIAHIINTRIPQQPPLATVISVDGFHYPRSYLNTLPNSVEAYEKRGAPWTFDAEGIIALITCCKTTSSDKTTIYAPSFDHALKDPVENSVAIENETGILIFEGNYLLVNEKPWDVISKLVDERWFVKVDEENARMRLAKRHLEAGIERSMESAMRRAEENDLVNGRWVVKMSRGKADVLIESLEEE